MDNELTQEQLAEFRKKLLLLQEELTSALTLGEESIKPVDLDNPIGRLTRMDAIQQQEMAKAGREKLKLRLKQIQAALMRMDKDEYGECLKCGEYIEFKRLGARPEAPFCLQCQTRAEK